MDEYGEVNNVLLLVIVNDILYGFDFEVSTENNHF